MPRRLAGSYWKIDGELVYISAERLRSGAVLLATIYAGHRVAQRYVGYTVKVARAMFRTFLTAQNVQG